MNLSIKKKQNLTGWAFLTPAAVLIFIMNFIPIIKAIFMSLQSGKPGQMRFAGLSNYIRIFADTRCREALKVTLEYVVITVPFIIVLALILAGLLNDPKLKLKGICSGRCFNGSFRSHFPIIICGGRIREFCIGKSWNLRYWI